MIATVNSTPEIPVTLSVIIGDIVLHFGELERALITAHARIFPGSDILGAIGKFKENSDTLGDLIKKLKKDFKKNNFSWINFEQLDRLRIMRNGLAHDSLVQQKDGSLTWQSNSKNRPHRPVDYAELLLLRECVERTITQIETGSMAAKKK
jgi:hypothetical protein